ncbi:hypothetical protein ACJX0J_013327, partial [Zea mays]
NLSPHVQACVALNCIDNVLSILYLFSLTPTLVYGSSLSYPISFYMYCFLIYRTKILSLLYFGSMVKKQDMTKVSLGHHTFPKDEVLNYLLEVQNIFFAQMVSVAQ